MGKLLEISNLKTYFRTREGWVHAVDGVSFSINEGEKLGIVGESGCGKSVTALSIMRLIPSPPGETLDGSIIFGEQDLLELSESTMRKIRGKQIGMIFQDPLTSLNPVLTIGYQIAEGLKLHLGLDNQQARRRAIELLREVGIPEAERRLNSYPHQFSGGMRQRVMIAIALACRPQLIIADEPTTALDVTVQAQILELIDSIGSEYNSAVMLITHDLGVVAGMTDRVVVMYAGHVVEVASTDELFANPRHPYTLGLLASVPRLDEERQEELTPIEGAPPDLLHPPEGCPFAPRCLFATNQCKAPPPLRSVGNNHVTACWYNINEPADQQRAAARREARARRLAMLDATAQAIVAAGSDGQIASNPDEQTAAN
ncbi:MAG TPA: ABC transporter ATP-binding protein [Ktedonobacterales bacterium]